MRGRDAADSAPPRIAVGQDLTPASLGWLTIHRFWSEVNVRPRPKRCLSRGGIAPWFLLAGTSRTASVSSTGWRTSPMSPRAETDRAARRFLFEQFADSGCGDSDPEPVVQLGYDDTLNLALIFGRDVIVSDSVSWIISPVLAAAEVDTLECPDLRTTPHHARFLAQCGQRSSASVRAR